MAAVTPALSAVVRVSVLTSTCMVWPPGEDVAEPNPDSPIILRRQSCPSPLLPLSRLTAFDRTLNPEPCRLRHGLPFPKPNPPVVLAIGTLSATGAYAAKGQTRAAFGPLDGGTGVTVARARAPADPSFTTTQKTA